MVRVYQAGNTVAEYTYNALDQRVIKRLPNGAVTYYLYNEQGQLLGEYDSAGNPVREYPRLGFLPLIRLVTSGDQHQTAFHDSDGDRHINGKPGLFEPISSFSQVLRAWEAFY